MLHLANGRISQPYKVVDIDLDSCCSSRQCLSCYSSALPSASIPHNSGKVSTAMFLICFWCPFRLCFRNWRKRSQESWLPTILMLLRTSFDTASRSATRTIVCHWPCYSYITVTDSCSTWTTLCKNEDHMRHPPPLSRLDTWQLLRRGLEGLAVGYSWFNCSGSILSHFKLLAYHIPLMQEHRRLNLGGSPRTGS